jgi:hypothetical protein
VNFGPSFGRDKVRNVQWQGFIRKAKLANAPDSFQDVISIHPIPFMITLLFTRCPIWQMKLKYMLRNYLEKVKSADDDYVFASRKGNSHIQRVWPSVNG